MQVVPTSYGFEENRDAHRAGGLSDGDKGDITVSGSGATWTVDNSTITLAKMADVATGTLFYRKTASDGAPEVQTLATLKTDLGLTGTNSGDQTITLTGDVTGSGTGSFAATVADGVISNAKLRDSAALSVIGRSANSTGDAADIAAGTDGHVLRRSGTTLGFGTIATAGIANNAVTLAKLATQTNNTILGNVSGSTAVPTALTATQVTALLNAATTSLQGAMSAADKTKLDGVATSATANSSDATLLARANHTGTQSYTTITGLAATATSADAAGLTGTLDAARLSTNQKTRSITVVIDGGGDVITTGVKGFIEIPFSGTITGWTALADQSGSIVVDVWKDTYANYPPTVADTIAGSEKPTISAATKAQDLSLSSWTTSVTAGDIIGFNVDSATTVERVTIARRVTAS